MTKSDHTTCKITVLTGERMKFYKKIFECRSLEELINFALDNLHERSIQMAISFSPVHTDNGIVYKFPEKIDQLSVFKKAVVILPN